MQEILEEDSLTSLSLSGKQLSISIEVEASPYLRVTNQLKGLQDLKQKTNNIQNVVDEMLVTLETGKLVSSLKAAKRKQSKLNLNMIDLSDLSSDD